MGSVQAAVHQVRNVKCLISHWLAGRDSLEDDTVSGVRQCLRGSRGMCSPGRASYTLGVKHSGAEFGLTLKSPVWPD